MSLNRGDIILLPFPWTDLTNFVVRPALVISDNSYNKAYPDAVFLFITTREHKNQYDFRLKDTDSSFKSTGLRESSTFRIAKLATLEQSLAKRRLGFADKNLLGKIEPALKVLLNL